MNVILSVNGMTCPIGVETQRIRFSVQTESLFSYDKIVYEFYERTSDINDGVVYKSVVSKEMIVYYDRNNFKDCTEYIWLVKIYSNDKVYVSNYSRFETGISQENFKAKWIENEERDKTVSEFRKVFFIDEKILKARLCIVGLGYYISSINGVKTDDDFFKPLFTDYDIKNIDNHKWYNKQDYLDVNRTICYDTYDITKLLKLGENTLNVLLGTGWYCNLDKSITDPCFSFGNPKLLFEIYIETEYGIKAFYSDENVEVRNTNIISQLYAGDRVDFSKEKQNFILARLADAPVGRLCSPLCEKDAVIEELYPISQNKDGKKIEVDFGKNHSGGLELKLKGKKGTHVIINFYESKYKGCLNPFTSRWIAYKDSKYEVGYLDQVSEYILSGGDDVIVPYFHWNCYRFVTIESDGEIEIKSLKSLFISTNINESIDYYFEDEFLNELIDAYILTQRDNMHSGVPSDCPHREKLPYTGDGQLITESALYLFESENFFRKWLNDIVSSQRKDGYIPNSAPYVGGDGGYWWSVALIEVTSKLYSFTGDKEILRQALIHCLKLIKYFESTITDTGYIKFSTCGWGLGDWLAPEPISLNKDFMNTLAGYYAVIKTIDFCKILSIEEHNDWLKNLQQCLKKGINDNFFDFQEKNYVGGVQGANVLPILFEICDEKYRPEVINNTIEKYKKDKHFDTGIVLTPKLLDLLTSLGESNLAYEILTEKSKPSYYDMLKGETTLSEHWYKCWPNNPDYDVSHCHPMFGSVVSWIIKNVAGLDFSEFYNKRIIFAPKVIEKVKMARISRQTPYGLVSINYCSKDSFMMQICVPSGVEGEIVLPTFIKHLTVNGKFIIAEKKNDLFTFSVTGGEYAICGDLN